MIKKSLHMVQSLDYNEMVQMAHLDNATRSINGAKRMIFVNFRREGIHKFPDAATNPDLSDVSFLGFPHRHIFHFKVSITVAHNDREIEFIQFKRWCESLYNDQGPLNLETKSCEMISDDLFHQIAMRYPGREVTIEVSEDGENGCHISYPTIKKIDQK